MIKNLICDLDDTLLQCSDHYEDCKIEFMEYSHTRTGLPKKLIRSILEAIDTTGGQLHHFTKERWPISFGAASAALDALQGHEVDRLATKHAYDIGNNVFDCAYEPLPGAMETLDKYHKMGYNLILYTKGDVGVQKQKIVNNGLGKYFSPGNTYIVNRKDGDVVRKIINDQYILPAETCLIGDNFLEDVQSALDAKIMAVHIKPDASGDELESINQQCFIILHSFADLPTRIPPVSHFANFG